MDMTLVLVTLLSLLVAAVMTAFAWRLAQEERRREQARVDALAAEIHRASDWPLREAVDVTGDVPLRSDLFTETQTGSGSPRGRVRAAIAILFAACVVAAFVGVGAARARSSAVAANAPVHNRTLPLELTALTHERDADRLIVRGVVRNAAPGPALHRLTAVVALFDHDGQPAGTGGAPIDAPTLASGESSRFAVSIPGAAAVARYRVSFRTDEAVIPHVDRRVPAIAPAKQP